MNEMIFFGQAAAVYLFTVVLFYSSREVLAGWMGLLGIMANIFVAKQVTLFGLDVTASDIYAVGLYLTLNIIQEFDGREAGNRAMKIAFGFQIGFLALAYLHLLLQPNGYDASQTAFEVILSTYPRILAASLLTLWTVQKWDLMFFQWVKQRFSTVSFTFRNLLTLGVSQALDTLLFTFLALWGIVGNLGHIILLSFLIKGTLIALTPLITYPLRKPVLN
ncbi:MAG: queuosine precursor transporter [Chlamydiia bacterium]|nr:queuosine precursor transporter [Chlamydiia bacterium]